MSFIKINRGFLIAVIGLIVLSILLEFYYCNFVCVKYVASGFSLDFSWLKYIESKVWFAVLLFISLLINKKSSFISALYMILLLMVFVPGHIIYAYSDGLRAVFYSTVSFFLIVAAIAPLRLKINVFRIPDKFSYIFLVLFTILLVIPIFNDFRFRINTNVLMLSDIYDVRSVLKENISFISGYTFWWLAKVVLPVLLIYSLSKKDYKITILAFAVLLYLFLISGHKSVYFTPVLILFYYYVGKNYNEKIALTMVGLFVFFILINVPDFFIGRPIFKSIFIRRMFFVPALLNECYFDFFQGNPIQFSHSVLSDYLVYPYDLPPEYLIGREYFGKPEMSSNAGIIANGFMNFGYYGVFAFSVIFSGFLMILNSIKLNRRYFGLFIFFMFIFRGSPFFTTILTHGFWIVLVLAFTVLPQKKKS
jgi:hypothetical protein